MPIWGGPNANWYFCGAGSQPPTGQPLGESIGVDRAAVLAGHCAQARRDHMSFDLERRRRGRSFRRTDRSAPQPGTLPACIGHCMSRDAANLAACPLATINNALATASMAAQTSSPWIRRVTRFWCRLCTCQPIVPYDGSVGRRIVFLNTHRCCIGPQGAPLLKNILRVELGSWGQQWQREFPNLTAPDFRAGRPQITWAGAASHAVPLPNSHRSHSDPLRPIQKTSALFCPFGQLL
jgi:hypothetical protein